MPRIPQLNSNVKIAPMSGAKVQAQEASFGGGAVVERGFQAATQVAQGVNKFVQEEKSKADDLAVTKAYADAVKAKNDLMYNPNNGAVTRKGQDAFGVMDEYVPEYDKRLNAIENNLHNSDQKMAFEKIKIRQKLDLDGDLQRHLLREHQAFDQETTMNALDVAKEDAIYNYQTPGKVGEAIDIQKAMLITHAQRSGKGAEWLEMNLKKVESDTHRAVIERMLANGEDQKASVYYNTVKGSFTGKDATTLERVLEEGSLRGNSQRITDSIMARDLNMTQAFEEARKIQDPKLRDSVFDRIRSDFALEKAAESQEIEELNRKAYNIVDKTGDYTRIPERDWVRFTGPQRAAIKSYARQKLSGVSPKTDMEIYYGIKDMAADPQTREKFLTMDLMKFRDKLSDADFKSFVKEQTDAKQGKVSTLDGWRTDTQIIKDSLSPIIDTKTPAGKEKFVQAARMIEDQQIAMQQKLGRKLNNKEMQELVDNVKIQGITERGMFSFFDKKKSLFELKRGETFEVPIDEVPDVERNKIEDALRKNGMEVNEANILKLYTRKLQGIIGAN